MFYRFGVRLQGDVVFPAEAPNPLKPVQVLLSESIYIFDDWEFLWCGSRLLINVLVLRE